MEKIVTISDDYYDIGQLLLITIIASSKNCFGVTASCMFKQLLKLERSVLLLMKGG